MKGAWTFMAGRMKRALRFMMRGLLSLAAVFIIALIILQLVLIGSFSFLNAGKGRELVENYLRAATQDSGYDVTIGVLYYDPVRGINMHDFVVRDDEGVLIALDRLSVRIMFEKLLARHLDITMMGGTLTLNRLPVFAQTPEDAGAPTAFTMPDIFFRRISLSHMNWRRVVIGADIAGEELTFAPYMAAHVALRDDIRAAFVALPRVRGGDMPIPRAIRGAFRFDPQTMDLDIERLRVEAANYRLSASGSGRWAPGGVLDYKLDAGANDAQNITGGTLQRAFITATLGGHFDWPVLEIDGHAVPDPARLPGLGTITLSVKPDEESTQANALVRLDTTFHEQDAAISAYVTKDEHLWRVTDLLVRGPKIAGGGDLRFDPARALADGHMTLDISDLSFYSAFAGVGLAGALDTQIILSSETGAQALTAILAGRDLRYAAMQAGRFTLDAHMADLSRPWPERAEITLSNAQNGADMTITQLRANFAAEENGAHYRLDVNGRGGLPDPFTIKGGARLSELAGDFPVIEDVDINFKADDAHMRVHGALRAETLAISARLDQMRPQLLLGSDAPPGLANVRMSGDVGVNGSASEPVVNAQISIASLLEDGRRALALALDAGYQAGLASLSVTGAGPNVKALRANLDVPVEFALHPFAARAPDDGALSGQFNADLDIEPIANLLLPPTQEVDGNLGAEGRIGGTIAAPDVSGTIHLADGRFYDMENGIDIQALNLRAALYRDRVDILRLSATDGEQGRLSGAGAVGFNAQALPHPLRVEMVDFHLPKSALADGRLGADLTFASLGGFYKLSGQINVAEMNILIPERFGSTIPQLNIVEEDADIHAAALRSKIALDIGIEAHNQVFVRGWGLDAEFGGAVHIGGDARAPLFDGTLGLRRGRYEEFGRRFTLARANLLFQGAVPPSPYLDIRATINAGDVEAAVELQGAVRDPSVRFASVPALPEDEVLSRILFGSNTSSISPYQAVQLAQTLRRFSGQGGGGFNPVGMLRNLTGLDDLSIEMDADGQASLGVGKYLTDKVYLQVKQGAGENSGGAKMQIELTPRMSVETEMGQDARAGGGLFWKRDY